MVGGRFHQEKDGICFVGVLDLEVCLGSASSLLELCPRRIEWKGKPRNGKLLPGMRETETETVVFFDGVGLLLVVVVVVVVDVVDVDVVGSICHFCPWLQEFVGTWRK